MPRLCSRSCQLSLMCAVVVIAGGCRDSADADRSQAIETIHSAQASIEQANAIGLHDDDAGAVFNSYEQAIRNLDALNTGDPVQIAAAKLAAADARLKLAKRHGVNGHQYASAIRSAAMEIDGLLDAAILLASVAAQYDEDRTMSAVQSIDAFDRDVEHAHHQHMDELTRLAGPIQTATSEIEDLQREIDRLHTQAFQHFRDAEVERGLARLEIYEKGAVLAQQAIERERELNLKLLQLDDKQREYDHLQMRAERASVMSSDAELTRRNLSAYQSQSHDLANESLAVANSIAADVSNIVAQLEEQFEQLQSESHAKMLDLAQRAAASARSAAGQMSGDGAGAARLTAVGANRLAGDTYSAEVSLIDVQVGALQRISDAKPVLPSLPDTTARINSLLNERSNAEEAAIRAYNAAKESVGQLRRSAVSRSFQTSMTESLDKSVAALSREYIPVEQTEDADDPRQPSGVRLAGLGDGAESPEALASALKSARGVEDLFFAAVPNLAVGFSSKDERQAAESVVEILHAVFRLDRALYEQFNSGLIELAVEEQQSAENGMAGMGAMDGMPIDLPFGELSAEDILANGRNIAFDAVELGDVSGNSGSINLTLDGDERECRIQRIGGRWFLAPKELEEGMLSGGEGDVGMSGMILGKIQALKEPIIAAVSSLTGQVTSGQFDSIQAFKAAAVAQFEQLKSSGQLSMPMGGMPGGRMPEGF